MSEYNTRIDRIIKAVDACPDRGKEHEGIVLCGCARAILAELDAERAEAVEVCAKILSDRADYLLEHGSGSVDAGIAGALHSAAVQIRAQGGKA